VSKIVAIIEWAKADGIVQRTSTQDGMEWCDSRVEWYLSGPDLDTNKPV
jgi:hypothetical protein